MPEPTLPDLRLPDLRPADVPPGTWGAVSARARHRRRARHGTLASALVLATATVAVLAHAAVGSDSTSDDVLAGPSVTAPTSTPGTTESSPVRTDPASPAVRAAARQLVLSLGVPATAVTVRWAHGPVERALALADSAVAMGVASSQQAWVIEADSAVALTCTACFGVVPQTGRVHGVIVLDSSAPQTVGAYLRDDPADLRPLGVTHQLPPPY